MQILSLKHVSQMLGIVVEPFIKNVCYPLTSAQAEAPINKIKILIIFGLSSPLTSSLLYAGIMA